MYRYHCILYQYHYHITPSIYSQYLHNTYLTIYPIATPKTEGEKKKRTSKNKTGEVSTPVVLLPSLVPLPIFGLLDFPWALVQSQVYSVLVGRRGLPNNHRKPDDDSADLHSPWNHQCFSCVPSTPMGHRRVGQGPTLSADRSSTAFLFFLSLSLF